jgi:hypothetical protein
LAVAVWFLCELSGVLPKPSKTQVWNTWVATAAYKDAAATVREDRRKFINRWGKRFEKTGTVLGIPRTGRSKQIPKNMAKLAAMYLKTGYWKPVLVQYRNGARVGYTHRYYTTVRSACKLCAELDKIRTDYNLTYKQLLYHMKAADPKLVRRSIRVKKAFTPEELQHRTVRATTLYSKCHTMPGWLDRCYFVDECSIWLDNEACKGTRVYCDAYDKGYQTVIHYEKHPYSIPIKVRFIAAENAVHGLVYLEFTTHHRHHSLSQRVANPATAWAIQGVLLLLCWQF